jgi:hypothetical protein
MTETPFNSKRRLCPDGSCIGVIGADGRCSVCGRNAAGQPDLALVNEASGGDDDDDAMETASAPPAELAGGFDAKRRLCDDGSCVGVIGADGRCSVCGKPPEGANA